MKNTVIDDRMRALGVTKNYKGYNQLKRSVELGLEDEDRLYNVSKRLYNLVAQSFGCSCCSVYRNIKTISENIWKYNYTTLCMIAGYKITNQITATDLVSILVANIQRSQYRNAS